VISVSWGLQEGFVVSNNSDYSHLRAPGTAQPSPQDADREWAIRVARQITSRAIEYDADGEAHFVNLARQYLRAIGIGERG
jgi:hypothetical protein